MRTIRTPGELAAGDAALLTYTVGNFDGLHLGHQAVIAELVGSSRARGASSVAVTFDPHPVAVVAPDHAPELLTPTPEKLEALRRTGVDVAMVVDFTSDIAAQDASTFLAWLGVGRGAHLVLGYDFQMGHNRRCDLAALSAMGSAVGFGLDIVPPVEHEGLPISSSRIRRTIAGGDMEDAAAMLGRSYQLTGEVVRGSGVGREMGAPTANLSCPPGKLLPADGVYFATVDSMAGRPGLLYVGKRPTLGTGERVPEVHVLDLSADLYGAELTVSVRRRMRADSRFESAEALSEQIARDVERARSIAGAGEAG